MPHKNHTCTHVQHVHGSFSHLWWSSSPNAHTMRRSHLEDSLFSLWREDQVETLTVGEGPVINQ